MSERMATVTRETAETRIRLALDLDGTGSTTSQTGIGFFDHMLTLLGKHALLDLTVEASGDLFSRRLKMIRKLRPRRFLPPRSVSFASRPIFHLLRFSPE